MDFTHIEGKSKKVGTMVAVDSCRQVAGKLDVWWDQYKAARAHRFPRKKLELQSKFFLSDSSFSSFILALTISSPACFLVVPISDYLPIAVDEERPELRTQGCQLTSGKPAGRRKPLSRAFRQIMRRQDYLSLKLTCSVASRLKVSAE